VVSATITWNAPLLISLKGFPDRFSLIKALACFQASEGTSRIAFSDNQAQPEKVVWLRVFYEIS